MEKSKYHDLELEITPFEIEDVISTASLDDIPRESDSDLGEWFS